jgi:hypothetical protein
MSLEKTQGINQRISKTGIGEAWGVVLAFFMRKTTKN